MAKVVLSPSRPKREESVSRKLLVAAGVDFDKCPCALIGMRGYYLDTMGAPGKNNRGIYDDAILFVSPETYVTVNANVDPSIFRQGIATLKPGLYFYKKGNHGISRPGGGYPAFRPATEGEELPVVRDGVTNAAPGVAINIHKGGYNTTSSEGCQTAYPDQWLAF